MYIGRKVKEASGFTVICTEILPFLVLPHSPPAGCQPGFSARDANKIPVHGSWPAPAIWSHHTGHRIPCFDSFQFIITWMSNIKDIPRVMALLSYFSWYGARWTDVCTYGQPKCRIIKFLKYWAPLACLRALSLLKRFADKEKVLGK